MIMAMTKPEEWLKDTKNIWNDANNLQGCADDLAHDIHVASEPSWHPAMKEALRRVRARIASLRIDALKRKKNPSFTSFGYGNIRRIVLRGDKFKVARALADAHIPFAFVKQAGVNTVGDIGKRHLAKLSKFLGEHPSFEGRFAAHKDRLAANKRKKNPKDIVAKYAVQIMMAKKHDWDTYSGYSDRKLAFSDARDLHARQPRSKVRVVYCKNRYK